MDLHSLLEAVRIPLADLLRATADWLDSETEPEEPDAYADPEPKWIPNDRGGFDPA